MNSHKNSFLDTLLNLIGKEQRINEETIPTYSPCANCNACNLVQAIR